MKSSRWLIPAVVVLGLLAGAAIVGRPAGTSDLRLPLDSGSTTSTTAAPAATAAPSTTVASGPDTSSALLSTTTTTTTSPTTTVPDPATVRVVVGNASARNGLATVTADELIEAGYVDVVPTNAIEDAADSFIVYRDGFQAAAIAIAELLDIQVEQVVPFIDTAVTERDDEGDVIVVVGADRAA